MAQALELEQSWEVEVSALLVHLGAVTLPAETAEKLYAGAQLTAGEQGMVDRVPELTRQILGNIPRLEGVLEILDNYQTSYGAMGAGRSLPVGARILRIALDYDALEARGTEEEIALAAMLGRGLVYDPDLLVLFGRVAGANAGDQKVRELTLDKLRPGMLLAGDVRSDSGALLIARGHRATDQLIARLLNLRVGSVHEPLMIIEDAPAAH
jgi:hypothetical protein